MTPNLATPALPTATPEQARRTVAELLRPRRLALIGVIALFAAGTAVGLIGPWLLGVVADEVTGAQRVSRIDAVAVGFLAVTVVGAALAYVAELRAVAIGERVLAQLRRDVFARLLRLPLSTVERAGTGELLARVTGDVAALSRAVRYAVPSMVLAAIELVLTGVALLLLSPVLAAAALLGAPLAAWAARWYLRRSGRVYRAERERSAVLTTELHEAFAGSAAVLAHRTGNARIGRIRGAGEEVFRRSMAGAVIRNVLRGGVGFGSILGLGAVLGVGALLLSGGSTTIGTVTAAAFYVLRLANPINTLMEFLDVLQTAGAAFARIVGVLDLPDAPPPALATPTEGAAVSLRGVRFGYLPGVEVLHGVDLDVARGERLALVGPSGAGKSTIAALVAGIHPPGSGTVAVRGDIALLTQESHTFLGTVAANLRLPRPSASTAELTAALRQVGALGWVTGLPDGLDTAVGSDGHRLTSAQHQQLGLARLVLADPDVVVLDEATADFDSAAVRTVEQALDAALRGRTVIAIAHRLHAAAAADRVAVVVDGRIVELDSHDDLLAAGGGYAALWSRWQQHRQPT